MATKTPEQINAEIAAQKAAGKSGNYYDKPTGEYNLKAYIGDKEVYVKPREYVKGASLTKQSPTVNIGMIQDTTNTDPAPFSDETLSQEDLKKMASINSDQGTDFSKSGSISNRDGSSSLPGDLSNNLNTYKASMDSITKSLTNGATKPETYKAEQTFTDLTTGKLGDQYKTTDLETNLQTLKDQKAAIEERIRNEQQNEEGKTVAMGVISGKSGEAARQGQKEIDYINRKLNTVNEQLTTRYNLINNIMQLKQTDYENAKTEFDDNYKKNYDALTISMKIDDKLDADKQEEKKNSMAMFQTYSNLITTGALSLDNMTTEQKNNITKIETQAGYPTGTLQTLKNLKPKADIIAQSSEVGTDGYQNFQFVTRDQDGKMEVVNIKGGFVGVKKTGSGSGTGGAGSDLYETYKSLLLKTAGGDGKVNTDEYKKLRTEWGALKNHSVSEFDENFKNLGNASDPTFQSIFTTDTKTVNDVSQEEEKQAWNYITTTLKPGGDGFYSAEDLTKTRQTIINQYGANSQVLKNFDETYNPQKTPLNPSVKYKYISNKTF